MRTILYQIFRIQGPATFGKCYKRRGCLIVLVTLGIVSGIMHFYGGDPAAPQESSAPAQSQQPDNSVIEAPSSVSTNPEPPETGSPAKTNAFVAQANRDYAEGHLILIRRCSEGDCRQIVVELAQAEDRAQSEAERRFAPEDVMAESTYQN